MSVSTRRSRVLMTALAGVALVVLMFSGHGGGGKTVDESGLPITAAATTPPVDLAASSSSSARVPVTIYVMSRCPDAQFCEGFLQPLLEPLKAAVRLRAEYIVREEVTTATAETTTTAQGDAAAGAPNPQTTTPKLACMHGAQECLGNKQQLCLQKRLDDRIAKGQLSADASVDVLLKFLTCGWRRPSEIGTEPGAKVCLSEVGWSKDAAAVESVLACARGEEGETLLALSHAATKAAGATNSCTIHVAGKRRCVRDGGQFKDCAGGSEPADFKKTICAALNKQQGASAAAVAACK